MDFNLVGVIGAGVMGVGVAQDLAQRRVPIVLLDRDQETLDKARANIAQAVRFQGMFAKEVKPVDSQEILSSITFTTDYAPLANADFIIENVTESWPLKRDIYPCLDAVAPPHCVFAANTSCIPITRIAGVTKRPDKVLGIHFMNPVPLKSTVEMIRGYHTSQQSLDIAIALLARMGKEAILVNDGPGFVSNRILMLTVNEAIFAVQDGTASAEDVDRIFKSCFGHKMGPLETADLIGLDTILYSIEVLHESFADSKYRPCPLLRKMVDAGLLGCKSGHGFYQYGQ